MALSKQPVPFPSQTNSSLLAQLPQDNLLSSLVASRSAESQPALSQRGLEAYCNKAAHLTSLDGHFYEANALARNNAFQAIHAILNEWNEAEAQHDGLPDLERQAFIQAKQNDLARVLETLNRTQHTLAEEHAQHQTKALRQRPDAWVKRTWRDDLEDAFTLGESVLERNGHPPLSFGESWLNVLTLGSVAEKKFRDYERARLTGSALPTTPDDDEDVIEVPYATKD